MMSSGRTIPKRPLDGIVVVELAGHEARRGERFALAIAGRIAADLGATILKIEPPSGDPLRRLPPLVGGETGAVLAVLNAGKRSVVPADDTVLRRLIRRSPALLADAASLVPWASEVGSDLPPETACACVSVSLMGQRPQDRAPASEFTVMALGGLLDIVGDPAREPLRLGGHQTAYSAGLAAFTGMAAALCAQSGSDDAVHRFADVRVSLLETAVWLNWKTLATAASGRRAPSRSGQAADWPMIRCADGWVALVYQDPDWPGIRRLAGDDPRLADPALATVAGRQGRTAEIGAVVEEHLVGRTRGEIREIAMRARLPLGPVADFGEILSDPHLAARDFFRTVTLDGRAVAMPRLPLLWNGHVMPPGDVPSLAAGYGAP